ncbi:uncharacterized protein NEMAJ01_0612 [Nematocida major]|uniref:uncharacterized protein n=1 Tax=Nematocida major TaxID=1912982 RepID=UPI002007E259|nr:uncharacterized protein NEMAJ01_0612 [Nematocida major]KAH9385716.1 hypothetical protein NEMAJ01_0612 [Nematocida major]
MGVNAQRRGKSGREMAEILRGLKTPGISSGEIQALLEKHCPHVDFRKYVRGCGKCAGDSMGAADARGTSHGTSHETCCGTHPPCLALLEESLLYAGDLSRAFLGEIVRAIEEEMPREHLIHVHKMLSNTLISSHRCGYAHEYDRWLVLAAIKIMQVLKREEYVLEYFPCVAERISADCHLSGGFRDRAVILSDYLTQGELLLESGEAAHFSSDVPRKPRIEEVCESPDEDAPEEPAFISTLAEYYFTVKSKKFESEPPEEIRRVMLQLPGVLRRESPKTVKKLYLEIVQVHASILTKESLEGICSLLLQGEIAWEILSVLYDRDKYSLHFRRVIVQCLGSVLHRLRGDVLARIVEKHARTEYSAEDVKLGIPRLFSAGSIK